MGGALVESGLVDVEAHTQHAVLPRDCCGTATGGVSYLLDPVRSDIRLFDLAVAQARICRFGGHLAFELDGIYSVAQHAVLTSYLCEMWGLSVEFQLAALLHDAAEARLGDVISPQKWLLGEPFAVLERRWEYEIFKHFGIAHMLTWRNGVRGMSAEVKRADRRAFELECWDLLPTRARERALPGMSERPEGPHILPLDPERATVAWLRRFWELTS